MEFKRTVCSVIAGVLIIAHTPAYTLDGFKRLTGYVLFYGSCLAVGWTGKWLYDNFMGNPKHRAAHNLMHTNIRQTSEQAQQAHAMVRENIGRANDQRKALAAMHVVAQRAAPRAQQLPQATQDFTKALKPLQEMAARQAETQQRILLMLQPTSDDMEQNNSNLNMVKQMLPGIRQTFEQNHTAQKQHVDKIENNIIEATRHAQTVQQGLEQYKHNLGKTYKVMMDGFKDIQDTLAAIRQNGHGMRQHAQCNDSHNRQNHTCVNGKIEQ